MGNFSNGSYWAERKDLLYYRYIDYIVRVIATNANFIRYKKNSKYIIRSIKSLKVANCYIINRN
jgi:hypothetical protein